MTFIKLQLDWKPNSQFAGILLAHHLGWYQQAEIELSIVPWTSHTNPMDALDAQENVVASTEDNLLIQARAADKAVKAIAAMMQYSGIGWIALKGSGIKDMTDLRGKRVGIHGDGETALEIALAHFGMDQTELEVIDIGFDYAGLLRGGECDAVQCFVMVEPLELEQMGLELEIMPAYKWGYEVYAQVIATTERLLASEPDSLVRFLKVTFDGWRQALQDPQQVAHIISDHYLPEADTALESQMLISMQPYLEGQVGLDKLGWMEKERWTRSIGYLVDHQLIDRSLPAEAVMTNHLMEAVYRF
jgi:ABC-type nitrate/sulfonate/bicarbonate transport system substrate-binding protein